MPLIGLSGGIGSGKSVVARILGCMGFPVYDCDSEARRIMASDTGIHKFLCSRIHPLAVVDGVIDRQKVSEVVFSDSDALKALNSMVHSAVFDDIARWCKGYDENAILFVESAILRSSGLVRMVDAEWRVIAPEEERIVRVIRRSGLSRKEVLARIEAQNSEDRFVEKYSGCPTFIINNSSSDAVLPQIHSLLSH